MITGTEWGSRLGRERVVASGGPAVQPGDGKSFQAPLKVNSLEPRQALVDPPTRLRSIPLRESTYAYQPAVLSPPPSSPPSFDGPVQMSRVVLIHRVNCAIVVSSRSITFAWTTNSLFLSRWSRLPTCGCFQEIIFAFFPQSKKTFPALPARGAFSCIVHASLSFEPCVFFLRFLALSAVESAPFDPSRRLIVPNINQTKINKNRILRHEARTQAEAEARQRETAFSGRELSACTPPNAIKRGPSTQCNKAVLERASCNEPTLSCELAVGVSLCSSPRPSRTSWWRRAYAAAASCVSLPLCF